ncbi:hypothetical protein [Hymenobacter sp. 102]|uniref:hypothetical protein n=1 Tax=Hymenobacter sp. 102 TaxID=3403152 RepID=UPI003CF39D61
MLQGLMMNTPLRIEGLLEHAEKWHADTEIVSRLPEGGLHYLHCLGINTAI